MLGVIANETEEHVVREFFELFKTPWEFYEDGRHYDVILCSGIDPKLPHLTAKLVIVYAGGETDSDDKRNVKIDSQSRGAALSYRGRRLPIYGTAATFRQTPTFLTEGSTGKAAAYLTRCADTVFARVGYDLFQEVETLFRSGQPFQNAAVPTLDLHIGLLRDLVVSSGIPLLEIPPVPSGHSFIACLTHDLDHASIRRHLFDSTILGFFYRATLGTAINAARGRVPVGDLLTNWAAAAKLPFMYLGVARDIWSDFDRYLQLEQGRPSTFFVVPFENRPGRAAPGYRATKYDISHIAEKVSRLAAAGCEIGLHGIDAWADTAKGHEERCRIRDFTKKETLGVRMHWLYSDEQSPAVLEQAGFIYDSTAGYNDTVGYRTGTAQVFKPLSAKGLLELPMHIMDTAMFYPDYLDLSAQEAWERITPMLDHAADAGGVTTVNWHDRSISPERLWGKFYVRLLDELTRRGAWFSTASQAVAWFGKRRSAMFHEINGGGGATRVIASADTDTEGNLPSLRARLHRSRDSYTDTAFDRKTEVCVSN
jgi:hypothetical protein